MFWNFLKGMAMGAADIVPGVSGGTIALLTGIYERLIGGIKSVGWDTLVTLKQKGLKAAWQQMDGTFLLSILAGAATSIILLSKVLHHLIETQPIMLWSFFFGLVLASVAYVTKQVDQWNIGRVALLILGSIVAALISISPAATLDVTPLSLFFAGSIAICAMILPGISGSFILLLMGMYSVVIGAVKSFDLVSIGIFAGGCLVGIMLFSRVLSWLLQHYHNATMALLSGFMLGALVKLWPWKIVSLYRMNNAGEQVPFIESPVWPWVHQEPQVSTAIVAVIIGFSIVFIMDRVFKKAK
jgi:putative membrane protein